MKKMWEIFVPTEMIGVKGLRPIRTRYHRVWDANVRAITGGLTILSPAKGQWVSPSGELFAERMIPVRVVATNAEMDTIIDFTMKYYNQEAILAYAISTEVIVKLRA